MSALIPLRCVLELLGTLGMVDPCPSKKKVNDLDIL